MNAEQAKLQMIADVFGCLSYRARWEILLLVKDAPRRAHEIIAHTKLSQPSVTKHIQALLQAGFIKREAEGSAVHFVLADPEVLTLYDLVRNGIQQNLAKELQVLLDAFGESKS